MPFHILGPDPFDRDDRGCFPPRVATIFPQDEVLVTLPGIHATQRSAYVDTLDEERRAEGLSPLTDAMRSDIWQSAVDLIIQRDAIHIRPDLEKIQLALEADELLQQRVPKRLIRFLSAGTDRVHDAIKGHGECWRITPRPISTDEMIRTIRNSRMAIGGCEIYYHNPNTGTRLLTCQAFSKLADLNDRQLQTHLLEIQHYSRCFNRFGNPEIDFLVAGRRFRDPLCHHDFSRLDAPSLREVHKALSRQFTSSVPAELRRDDPGNIVWRKRLLEALQPLHEDRVLEEEYLGLANEFHMHVQWLPGGRFVDGELIFDSVFDDSESDGDDWNHSPRDEKARELIFNYVRAYDDIDYINVGRVAETLSLGRESRGRREVYVVEMKLRDADEEILKLIRLQKWGVRERLDEKKDLLQAMIESEEYTEYILDRRLGCRRLGMNLPARVAAGRIAEIYDGDQRELHGTQIWTPYFERDYFHGVATDKIPEDRFRNSEYALKFAELLGRAAAPNMIVGRCNVKGDPFFDDGDEVIIEDEQGLPVDLIVTQHTGAFFDYKDDLASAAEVHSRPVNKRVELVDDPLEFAETYLSSLIDNFERVQAEYRQRTRAFDTLFKHRARNTKGSFAFRWECILRRLDATDISELREQVWSHFLLPSPSCGKVLL
ncbi:MAG: hypothetical protein ACC628_16055 [Pirellulaceae bacterium]